MTVTNVLLLPTSAVVANDRLFTYLPSAIAEFCEYGISHIIPYPGTTGGANIRATLRSIRTLL